MQPRAQRVRGLDQAAAEHVELVLVLGQMLRRDLDPHLVQRRLSFGADLVTVLGDDRDLADLREQRRREVVDLGGGRAASREDAEVDANLDARRLDAADAESEFRFAHHIRITGGPGT